MPVVALLANGVLGVRRHKGSEEIEYYAINGGIAEISKDKVSLLVDEADHADEIVASEVRAALEAAQEAKAKAKDQLELDKAQALIDRQTVRLKVSELRRHHRERSPEDFTTI
jgi:F-type H+-transporting ATPase subunit epsilon